MEYQPDPKRIAGEGGQISHVTSGSIAAQLGLQPGDRVLAVNNLHLRDVIDYRFALAEEQISVRVRRQDGTDLLLDIAKDIDDDLGIDFVEPLFDRLRTCNNKCPFCFLTQMPKGMRKTLYLKDDDYRLSFLYGNFVTLTNLDEADWQRIEAQRLSPMYISIHATDRALRAVLLGKRDVPDVIADMRRLANAGIQMHTQVVACPGVNDTPDALHRTITDLASLYPHVESISIVPVGLTKFRFTGKAPRTIRANIEVHETPDWIDSNWERQPLWNQQTPSEDWGFCSRLGVATDVPLRCYTPEEAARMIDLLQPYTERFEREMGYGFLYPSDEFYLLCGRTLPHAAFYDDYPQYSNGVGMTREFLDGWADAVPRLPQRIERHTSVALVCGTLIAPTMQQVVDRLNQIEGLTVRLLPVVNQFFGETVTVSGLLTGQDVVAVLREGGCQRALLPRVMFDHQGQYTLDEYTPQRIAEETHTQVAVIDDAEGLLQYVSQLTRSTVKTRRRGSHRSRHAA
ncbi:MAG: DUF512 domain-containing protein [Chloroflexaceae bacterium]|nr:DUF512 domain-containing protein [Chloroflexaceae bacterium]